MAAVPKIDTHRTGLTDACGRRIDHLRVSVTSACDLRCIYCRPGVRLARGRDGLSDTQRVELIRFLYEHYGLKHVRITGGEPLLYPGLVQLAAQLHRAVPSVRLALTTNGRRLTELAPPLRHAGLERLNISLDSLDPRRYRQITGGALAEALIGIESAAAAGFPPPRINAVILRGVNEREVVPLAAWALSRGSEIRFLEAMPIGLAVGANRAGFVPAAEIRERLCEEFSLSPIPRSLGETARRYHAIGRDCSGRVGLISPLSEPFCDRCSRIRLTADGVLYPCLLDPRRVDLRPAWRHGSLCQETAAALVALAASLKQPAGPQRQSTPMATLGG